ncbi:Uroporphyrinogen decarboxylase [Bythopirellula goksoeyrii]|uniref:Uroporphyrinogen decarboxylase n=1 Tax=Bythopirellula goksoeyrii TaxID=1400387 RepID=A0A5B9QG36_9BACT|nr:Uroporphyrinogen decarboxylase [Bythopirellula goksoeyrii]
MISDPPKDFSQLNIVALESRRAAEMMQLIKKRNGIPLVSPSLREVAVDEQRPVVDFANHLITGQIDAVLFLTGVGIRQMLDALERHVERQRFLDALSDVKTIVRGPKPLAVLRELGITPTLQVPEPNTWREVLATLDAHLPVTNLVVAVQEYGVPNVSLIAGLEARGARVVPVQVYRWALPEDLGPLEENVRRIAAGEVDACLFTSAQQAIHLVKVAENLQLASELHQGLRRTLVASIGPTTSEMLRKLSIAVDFEPSHGKMGQLVSELAAVASSLVVRKRTVFDKLVALSTPPATEGKTPAWYNSPFMKACRREPVPHTPIWLMRQAGRYMEEYRAVRAKMSFLELCKNPALCSEVMCTAVERLGVDAAIIFSDLLPILEPMGMELEFTAGDGPKIDNPVREATDVDRVVELENVDSLGFVMETVAHTRRDLPEEIPVIGFAGAPFTLASYAIEGGGSRSFLHTKTLMYRESEAWHDLMQRLSRSIVLYLNAQIAAGAQAVQLFDSWVGCLSPADYRTFVMPHIQSIVEGLAPAAPLIHFATGNPALLPLMAEAGGDVIGVDWRIDLAEAWQTVGYDHAVQGNLDPLVLMADRDTIRSRAEDVLQAAGNRPGHIFNLGHGVMPQTPVDNVRYLVDFVHEATSK